MYLRRNNNALYHTASLFLSATIYRVNTYVIVLYEERATFGIIKNLDYYY